MGGTAPLLAYGVSDCESSFVYYAGRTYLLQRRPGDVLRALARSGRVLVLTKAPLADDFVRAAPDRFRVVARQQDGPRRYALVEGARRPPG